MNLVIDKWIVSIDFIYKKMREEDIEISVKVVVVGNGAVGKSSMIQRYCKGVFTREYKKTIGVDFLEKMMRYKNYLLLVC